jgi:uncharacterized protein YycO
MSIISIIYINTNLTKPLAHVKPDYDKKSIVELLEKKNLSDEDYKEIFYQTGLGANAVDTILADKKSGKDRILKFQENLFKDININYQKITPITYQENIMDDKGNMVYGTEFAPYENGYILVTRATYSGGWRHGHAAIITDSEYGHVLEAAVLGEDSQIANIDSWKHYPNFILLKLKNVEQKKLDEIAEYAIHSLYKVPYKLTVGIFSSKYEEGVEPVGTHCSHLVWYPFKKFGYDLDSNGGLLITPQDIANSPYLEIVQIYGFNPKELWK